METVAVTDPPFNDAVIVALWAVAIDPAVTVKVAEADPDGTDTFAGTVSVLLLLAKPTIAPPLAATCVISRVHVAVVPEPITVGEHVNEIGLMDVATLRDVEDELPP